ncbi:uncharacterized protein LOC119106199 [Pollicipes pollicipes]|uniref:uncharacterized protein LOC119106199 n=1 Tax=Pollicipes pollicipes TaxID=41117 RepID=UPI001884FC5E|nr:uncharacterized protein LOC119106199 [Pollicipes pollicipes]
MGSASGGEEMSIKQRAANGDRHSSSRSYLLSTNMKLLVLLAVLGAASAQYQLYTGAVPYTGYNVPLAYNAYHAPIATYAAHPFVYQSLPYSFKPVEKEEPAVESRSKRSADEDQKADDATLYSTYAAHPLGYTAGYPYAYNTYPTVYNSAYNFPTTYAYNGYNAYHGYTPFVHSLKKRDTAEADQKADDATLISTYAAHPFGYPYARAGYATPYAYRSVYNTPASTHPITYNAFPYGYRSYVY